MAGVLEAENHCDVLQARLQFFLKINFFKDDPISIKWMKKKNEVFTGSSLKTNCGCIELYE